MRRLSLFLSLAAAIVALVALPSAVFAHPVDSEPQTMVISASGADVSITWNAAMDELGLLADVIGLGDGGEFLVFEDGALDQAASSRPPGEKLASAPDAVESYFVDHVTVTMAGERCRGELEPLGSEVTAGITVRYRCDSDVDSADIYADVLMDVDSRYVIAATSSSGDNRLYQDGTREFTWTFGVPHRDDDPSEVVLLGCAAALVLVALVVYFWRRRRAHAASR